MGSNVPAMVATDCGRPARRRTTRSRSVRCPRRRRWMTARLGHPPLVSAAVRSFRRRGSRLWSVDQVAAYRSQCSGTPLSACVARAEKVMPSLGVPEQHRPSAAGRVHHRTDIVHPLFQRRQSIHRHTVGQTGATLVEVDHPAERAQSLHRVGDTRVLPQQLNVGHPTVHEHQVTRPGAEDLIRDAATVAVRIPDVPHLRATSIPGGAADVYAPAVRTRHRIGSPRRGGACVRPHPTGSDHAGRSSRRPPRPAARRRSPRTSHRTTGPAAPCRCRPP